MAGLDLTYKRRVHNIQCRFELFEARRMVHNVTAEYSSVHTHSAPHLQGNYSPIVIILGTTGTHGNSNDASTRNF